MINNFIIFKIKQTNINDLIINNILVYIMYNLILIYSTLITLKIFQKLKKNNKMYYAKY